MWVTSLPSSKERRHLQCFWEPRQCLGGGGTNVHVEKAYALFLFLIVPSKTSSGCSCTIEEMVHFWTWSIDVPRRFFQVVWRKPQHKHDDVAKDKSVCTCNMGLKKLLRILPVPSLTIERESEPIVKSRTEVANRSREAGPPCSAFARATEKHKS